MSDVEQGKLCAILAWFFPIGLIWYFVDEKMKNNAFAKFHVKQSLVMVIFGLIVSFAAIIPLLGWLVAFVGNIMVFIFWIIGLLAAIGGNQKELPIIGQYANKMNF